MKCNGQVIYKGIEKREGGVFKNDRGQEVNYDASYVVKFDENVDGKIDERKVKFPATNTTLYEKIKTIEPYTKVNMICNVVIGQSACRLVLEDIVLLK